jgi:hypothetical protein
MSNETIPGAIQKTEVRAHNVRAKPALPATED